MSSINISTLPAFFAWKPAAWLRVSGEDAPNFLQGQFTNDLRGLAAATAVYGLWLNVKGKVVADGFVLRGADEREFWIGSYHSPAVTIRERLESHVIADDVMIEDTTAQWAAVTLLGAGVAGRIGDASRDGFVFPGRRGRGDATEWVFAVAQESAVRERLAGVREASAGEMARLRIDAGIPSVPADLGVGDLPNEGGLDAEAISYTKGCYLGQEVMARLKSMGQVRRRLIRVAGAGVMPTTLPAALFAGGRQVGELRSAAGDGAGGFVGLAMLTLMHVTAATGLAFTVEGEPDVRLEETR